MATHIVDLLKSQHQEMTQVLNQLEQAIEAGSDNVDPHFQKFKELFKTHDYIEDHIFYPELKKVPELNQLVLKGYQAHHVAHVGLMELRLTPYTNEMWGPKFLIVKDSIFSHMREEEDKLFPKVLASIDMSELMRMHEEATEAA